MKPLIHHLLGETRTAVLAALLLRPKQPLHVREFVRMTGASPGTNPMSGGGSNLLE